MGAEKIVRLETGKVYKQIEMFLKRKSYKSENTSKSYETDIKKFFKTIKDKELHFLNEEDVQITLDDVENYIEYLHDQTELSNKTINRGVSSVKQLLKYLNSKDLVNNVTFLDNIDRLPEEDNRHGILTVSEVLEMANLARTKERNKKEIKYYFILFALDTAIRKSAILGIKFSDFEVRETGDVVLKVTDKGNKHFRKTISMDFWNQLQTLKKTNNPNERVFDISKDAIDESFIRLRKLMNFPDERGIVFHSIRKASISFAYRLTNDILEAKRTAGHSNVNTTLLYIEEQDYNAAIGAVSSSQNLDMELFEKVSHEELLEAIRELKSDARLLLNLKLQEKIK